MQKALLNGVTATTTGTGYNIENIGPFSIQVIAAGISSGNGVFAVQASNDGTNWDTIQFARTAANTNSQTLVRDVSVTLSTNTNEMLMFDNFMGFKMIRVNVTVTTDGTYTAILHGTKRAT